MMLALLTLLLLPLLSAAAQSAATPDSLRLHEVRAAAARQDPRALQADLLERASELAVQALRSRRLPQISARGEATTQSEVVEIPIQLPGREAPSSLREQLRAELTGEWTIYDGGRIGRQTDVARARLEEQLAESEAAIDALRTGATELFFAALLTDARLRALRLAAEDLNARLRLLRSRHREGAALGAEVAALEAEQIRLEQEIDEMEATQRGLTAALSEMTGLPISSADQLALPGLDAEVGRLRQALISPAGTTSRLASDLVRRPELTAIRSRAERLEREAHAKSSEDNLSLTLFGRAGIGRPGPLNFLSDEAQPYGLAGVRLTWPLLDWHRTEREARALHLQAQIAETEAASLIRRLDREIEDELAQLKRIDTAIEQDARVLELREEVLRITRRQLEEGVALSDLYADRLSDLTEARITLERHRIERAQMQTELLATLGLFPDAPASTTRTN